MTHAEPTAVPTTRASWRHYLELTKPRLSMMSVITAMVGYLAAVPYTYWDWQRTVLVVAGTALCAGGVAALNMWMESDTDAKMERTAGRPIPTGVIAPGPPRSEPPSGGRRLNMWLVPHGDQMSNDLSHETVMRPFDGHLCPRMGTIDRFRVTIGVNLMLRRPNREAKTPSARPQQRPSPLDRVRNPAI